MQAWLFAVSVKEGGRKLLRSGTCLDCHGNFNTSFTPCAGVATLTHTLSSVEFLNEIFDGPETEDPFYP